MDVISHALIGLIVGFGAHVSHQDLFLIVFFSLLPDIFQIPLFLYLGRTHKRFLWYPRPEDWTGFRQSKAALLWNIPHSIFFVAFLVPFVYFGLPLLALAAYLLHIIVDVLTHIGEWGVRPFFPFSYQINGYTNSWNWSIKTTLLSWSILTATALLGFAR